ncbi:MAG TPA: glycosyltransferase family 2 protein [Firmicutes bacterium]|nr:glycosyltransferase family 2 protein [Bacillota bacterium]
MDNILKITFLVSATVIFLTYIFYPIFIFFLSRIKPSPSPNYLQEVPGVSVILPVYNEESVVRRRLENLLDQTLFSKLEIIVVSDASKDRTDEIVKSFNDSRIKLFRLDRRSGKAACINTGVEQSSNEILIFTDANTEFESDAIEKLVRNYGTFEVGGVCGYLEIKPSGKQKAESGYWKFERFLKEREGKLSSVCGANGAIYSIRKEYFKPLPSNKNVLDDFITSLQPLRFGKRLIFEREAMAREEASVTISGEYRRKIRIGNADFNSIKEVLFLLNIFKCSWVSVFFVFHKLLRWFAPVFLLMLYFSNLFINSIFLFFNITFIIQILFYLSGFIGWLFLRKGKYPPVLTAVTYFCIMNVSLLTGMLNWLTGDSKPYWEPVRR